MGFSRVFLLEYSIYISSNSWSWFFFFFLENIKQASPILIVADHPYLCSNHEKMTSNELCEVNKYYSVSIFTLPKCLHLNQDLNSNFWMKWCLPTYMFHHHFLKQILNLCDDCEIDSSAIRSLQQYDNETRKLRHT